MMPTFSEVEDKITSKTKNGRRDPEKHADQVRRANAARAAAVKRLIAAHIPEFDAYHEIEAAKRGVTPKERS